MIAYLTCFYVDVDNKLNLNSKERTEPQATATKKSPQSQITSQNQIEALRFTQMSS